MVARMSDNVGMANGATPMLALDEALGVPPLGPVQFRADRSDTRVTLAWWAGDAPRVARVDGELVTLVVVWPHDDAWFRTLRPDEVEVRAWSLQPEVAHHLLALQRAWDLSRRDILVRVVGDPLDADLLVVPCRDSILARLRQSPSERVALLLQQVHEQVHRAELQLLSSSSP